jgi:CheY-like chemotaxis protein
MPAILIVDDHAEYLSSVCRLLELHLPGTDVRGAHSASTALRLVQEQAFDLLILDYQLQVTTGTQLLRQLRARAAAVGHPLPPVIMSSSQPDVSLYARTSAVDVFVPKPLLEEHITTIILPLLSSVGVCPARRPLLWSIRRS